MKLEIRLSQGLESIAPIIDLRYRVLRKPLGHGPETARFEGDELPLTTHFSCFRNDELVGCATVLVSLAEETGQLRGMAVRDDLQGKKIGSQLLESVHRWAADNDLRLWCKARESAIDFYRSHQWEIDGETFDVPGIGPHKIMRWSR